MSILRPIMITAILVSKLTTPKILIVGGLNYDFSKLFVEKPTPPPSLFLRTPHFRKATRAKIAENATYFKTKLNTKWMDLCSTTAIKETSLISFECLNSIQRHENSFYVVCLEQNHTFVQIPLLAYVMHCQFGLYLPLELYEAWDSRVTKSSYETELRKMTSHFELLTRKILQKVFFRVTSSTS